MTHGTAAVSREDVLRLAARQFPARLIRVVDDRDGLTIHIPADTLDQYGHQAADCLIIPLPKPSRETVVEKVTRVDADPEGCAGDIVRLLRAAGHRMTTDEVLSELALAGNTKWNESKVKYTLSAMRECERLTNRQDCNPRGYGLPEWSE